MVTRIKLLAALVVLMVLLFFVNSSQAANLFSYDPEWMSDVPKIGGYVDVYWTYSDNLDGQYNGLEAEKFDFTVDRAEIFLQHRTEKMPWAEGYFEFSVTAFDETDITLDEAYLKVTPPPLNGITLTGGVFDVPIGIGPNENIDIWNWQFKMTNLLVVPWAFTGGMAEYSMGDIDLRFYIANGWGYSEAYGIRPTGRADPDTDKTFGGRIGFSPENFDTGISVVTGHENRGSVIGLDLTDPANPLGIEAGIGQRRTLIDWDFKLEKRPDWLNAFDLEFWYLYVDDVPQVDKPVGAPVAIWEIDDSTAFGAVVQTNFQTGYESLCVSFAYEIIDEEDGIVFGADPNTGVSLKDQTRQSFEVTPIWSIGDHIIVALTWRADWSDEDVFTEKNGSPDDFTWLAAWEWYYYF